MDYGKIISTGFKQAWKYKSLWIFGFLVSGGGSFNSGGNWGDNGSWPGRNFGDMQYQVQNFLSDNWGLILIIAVLVFFLFIIFWILNTISVGGLIDAARCLKNREEYRFGKSWSAGLKTFWPILGLGLLNFIVVFSIVIILVLIGVVCFMMHVGVGFLSLIFLFPIFICVIFIAEVTVALAKRMIVLDRKQVFDAIGDAVSLWKSKLGPTLIYSLIYFGLSIGIVIGTIMLILPIIIPLIGVAFVNVWLAIIIGIPILLVFGLIVSGYTGASMHLMTTEFYFQLTGYEPSQAALAGTPQDYYPPPSTLQDHEGSPLPPPDLRDHEGSPLPPTAPPPPPPVSNDDNPTVDMTPPEQQDYLPPQPPAPPPVTNTDKPEDEDKPPEMPRP